VKERAGANGAEPPADADTEPTCAMIPVDPQSTRTDQLVLGQRAKHEPKNVIALVFIFVLLVQLLDRKRTSRVIVQKAEVLSVVLPTGKRFVIRCLRGKP